MSKIIVGVLTGAVWFALTYAANAERVCREVCDHGSCVSKCVEHPDGGVVIHEHEHDRDPGPGVGIHIGR